MPVRTRAGTPSPERREQGAVTIAQGFTIEEHDRFKVLLKVAAESPFEGERANALAAATRLAARHGVTLEEAAAGQTEPPEPPEQPEPETGTWWRDPRLASYVHLLDEQIRQDKARRDQALQAAYARGLDAELRKPARKPVLRAPRNNRRREPWSHARVLLSETTLPLGEISDITGLGLDQVTALRLKLRGAA